MSIIPFGLSLVEAAAQSLIGPILIQSRNIGGFVADVTIREEHEDELVVTENPVDQGAAITDHSFLNPPHLTIEIGYSNSSVQSLGDPNYVRDMYTQFRALQASRQPFTVVTGKRLYENMLITLLSTFTDQAHENSMILTVRMKGVILVNTQTVSVPPASDMATPDNNGATMNQGTVQTQASPSASTSGLGGGNTVPFNYNNAPFSAGFGTGGIGHA